MRNETRVVYNAYLQRQAELNGIQDATKMFAVTNPVEQTLEDKIQESSGFLSRINVVGVTDQQGEKLGLSMGNTLASTTDTDIQDRATQDPTNMDGIGYLCTQTDFDSHVSYKKLDLWAKFKDFQIRMRNAITKRIALDRMMIGFNGTSRAATSDRGANPLLQDVNLGWIEKARVNAPARVLSEVVALSNQVTVGAAGDYKNLDALVYDAIGNLLPAWYHEDPEVVVVLGRNLQDDKYFPLIETHGGTPTEAQALDIMISNKRIGGKTAVAVPFFPANAMMITRLDNLSIYFQEGSRRRHIVENPKRNRIEDYQSVNESYVVEDHDGMCVVENIVIL